MEQTVLLMVIGFIVAIQTAIPYLVKRTVVFGVSIPDKNIHDRKLGSYKKMYALIIFFFSVIIIGFFLFWTANHHSSSEIRELMLVVIQFSILFLSMALYFYFHIKTLHYKKSQKWRETLKEVKITDLAVRSQDEMLPWYVYVLPMIVTVGLIGYTFLYYDSMPSRIPTHWGISGKPDAFTRKNLFSVNALLYVLLTMQLMFLGINEATKRSGIKLSATRTNASRIRQLSLRKYSSWFMFMISVLVTLLFTFLQLTTIHPDFVHRTVYMAIPLLFLLIVMISTIIFAVKVGYAGEQLDDQPVEGIVDVDEDRYWKAGIFYFNKNDPSIFVEKRFGVGWTINFANPVGYLITFGPLLIILVIAFLS